MAETHSHPAPTISKRMAPNVKQIVPIASGKGGVGKSTVSANLALALAKTGLKVGLMDADVYGPSIPTLLGLTEKPQGDQGRIFPVEKYGIKVISMGLFVPANEAVIWRGPMLHKMVQDFLGLVEWGELDYLLVDLPPGTGDIHLSLCQSIPLTGAVVVSTPQDVAWNVAQKAILMFDKLNAPVLGIVENMSYFSCTHCGEKEDIFGCGGARQAAQRMEIPFLGEIPLIKNIRSASDEGVPVVLRDPDGAAAKAFDEIASRLVRQISLSAVASEKKPMPVKVGPPNTAEILVQWNDGKMSFYKPRSLRQACPCAACVDEVTGRRVLDPASVPDDIRAVSIGMVGRYALQISWSDGHDTGLYGFEFLKKLDSGKN